MFRVYTILREWAYNLAFSQIRLEVSAHIHTVRTLQTLYRVVKCRVASRQTSKQKIDVFYLSRCLYVPLTLNFSLFLFFSIRRLFSILFLLRAKNSHIYFACFSQHIYIHYTLFASFFSSAVCFATSYTFVCGSIVRKQQRRHRCNSNLLHMFM